MNDTILKRDELLKIMKSQPTEVLESLFDELFISSDNRPLTNKELELIKNAKEEFENGQTISIQL